MVIMKTSYLLAFSAIFLFSLSCKPKNKTSVEVAVADWGLVEQEITLSDEPVALDEDTTIYTLPPTTGVLEDHVNYLRNNNRLKDWDPKKKKEIAVTLISEKDGSLIRPKIVMYRELDPSTNEWKTLDKQTEDDFTREAIRLLTETKIKPASNEQGEIVRSAWTCVVSFPPR